jgi:hypothetical protein
MKRGTCPSCDDVLEAFACEPETGKATLEKYLRDYPEYAEAILDFATEISREVVIRKEPLSARERAMIETGWKKHVKAAPKPVADPFAVLSGAELGKVANLLEVPKQVLTAFRDRTIEVASIPKRFAERLAAEIHSDFETLMAFLAAPPTLSVARSRKSETKPKIADRKTFEQILTDAGVAPADRKKLTAGD